MLVLDPKTAQWATIALKELKTNINSPALQVITKTRLIDGQFIIANHVVSAMLVQLKE
jgi:hypothetical protein